jgi:hypothetical protein
MRRFSLPLVIVGSILIAALLTWVTLGATSFAGREEDRDRGRTTVAEGAGPFKRIEVAGQAEVTLVQGATESVTIDNPSGKRSPVAVEVRNDTLHIAYTDRRPWWGILVGRNRSKSPEILVTFRDLDAIETAGAVKISAKSIHVPELRIEGAGGTTVRIDDLQTGRLRVSGSGAIRAEMSGRATEQTLSISGAGEYRGARLVSDVATVTVTGAGRVVVHAEKTLTATISGAGSVEYLGDPKVTERVSGAGSVRKRDAAMPGVRVARLD